MSRLMSVERFGEVQTIFSFVFLSGVILTVFYRIVLHITTNTDTEAPQKVSSTISPSSASTIPSLYTAAFVIHLPVILFLIIASPALSRFFAFETSWSFAVFALSLALAVPATFYGAYLHGRNEFTVLSVSQGIGAGGKLVFAVLLVLLGASVLGAVGALALASLMSVLYMRAKSHGFTLHFVPFLHTLPALKKEIPYGILVFLSLGLVTFLYSADVLIVKRLFSPEIAGTYSGIATIARIIFFATASIGAVLLSSIKIRNTTIENRAILKKAVIYVSVVGGGALLVFALFPVKIITLLIGAKYISMSPLLPLFSLSMFLISLLSLFVTYLLALRAPALLPISIIAFIAVGISILLNHATPACIVFDFAFATTLALILIALSEFFNKKTL